MTTGQLLDIFREFFLLAVRIGGPILLGSMLLGVVIAIFQAATQIHEQTISFALKLIVVVLVLLVGGGWMRSHVRSNGASCAVDRMVSQKRSSRSTTGL